MKILLVYYSRTGLTEKAALKIARSLNCQVEKLEDVKSRAGILGYLRSGKEAMKEICPLIKEVKFNPQDYDLIIIGTPVWAAKMASPVRTYLTNEKNNIKKLAVFLTQGGSGADITIKNMESLTGLTVLASVTMQSKEVASGSMDEKINLFVKQIKNL